jgi:hypothetical protein
MDLRLNPEENEEPGARLDQISPAGCKKGLPRASSERRLEMLLTLSGCVASTKMEAALMDLIE